MKKPGEIFNSKRMVVLRPHPIGRTILKPCIYCVKFINLAIQPPLTSIICLPKLLKVLAIEE
jgi:hypothetical protein